MYQGSLNDLSDLKENIMKTKTKIMIWISVLALLDMIIPIPFTALILIYVVSERPAWFGNLVDEIYNS
jgi:hypothetical protein